MSTLSWLHLSDWHQRGVDFDRDAVRNALVRDLEERRNISDDLSNIDFAVFSGDLAFSGKPEEYRVALHEFLEPILRACKLGFERLFIVPGNHDVDRDLSSLLRTDVRYFEDRAKLINTLTNRDAQAVVFGPMQAYARFVRKELSGAGCGRCTEFGFHCRFEVSGSSVCIVGLNSAWLCGTNKNESGEVDDYGNIVAGEMQLEFALHEAPKSDLVIGILHHPFHWLALKNGIDDRIKIRNRLMNECHLILHGHEHEPAVCVQSSTYGNSVIIPCGSAYDRRDPGNAMYANGYNLCTVNLKDGEGRVFLRRFDGDRRWLPDIRTSRPNADGGFAFIVPNKTEDDAPQVAKTTPRTTIASRLEPPPVTLHKPGDTIFVTNKKLDHVPTMPSDILLKMSGGISINVYVSPFGKGIRHLVNNRYVFAHAASTSSPYSNVVSLAHGPRKFSETEVKQPAWKVWIKNDANNSMLLMVDDTEEIKIGWHNFILRWDHTKPLLELLLDGKVVIAEPNYTGAWPTRFMTDISLGAWPRQAPIHYVETCIAGWSALVDAFDDARIGAEVTVAPNLPVCTELT